MTRKRPKVLHWLFYIILDFFANVEKSTEMTTMAMALSSTNFAINLGELSCYAYNPSYIPFPFLEKTRSIVFDFIMMIDSGFLDAVYEDRVIEYFYQN